MTSIIFNTLKENRKRILSWVCILSMFLNTLPVSSFASETGEIVPDPVEVVQEAVQEEPESVVPAVLPAEEQATVPASNEEEANVPVADVQDEEQDAPVAEPEPVLDNNADIAPVVGDIEPDASDIVPEGQGVASASEEVNLPSLFIDFPATGVFSGDSLSVSYKYTSAKDEELVISLDNIATEIEVKYLSDEMPVETVRTEDEETGYAYYRLSALKDEVYFIRIFVDKAEEEIPYSVTITEYKEPASDVEPEVENIDPDNAGDALIDIPPEATIDEPEASNDTEPDAGMVDIFPDLPDNNDTSAFDNFLNDNTEPAEETPAEENDGDEQEPAEDIVPVEPTNEEIPDENTDPVEPEGQVSEDLEETVGEEPAVEEPDVEPQDNNSEEDDDNDAQDAENPASDADLPDIIPDADNSASDAFDGFLVDDENNEEEPAEDNTAEEAPAVEAADENAAEDILDEEENPDDFLVTDDEEDSEEEPAPADETVDEPADEEAEESVPEENEQPDETTEGEEEPTEDATGEQDEVPTDKEEAESSDEDEAASDESESEDGEESSEGEEAEEPEEEETIGLDEETLTVIDGVYTYTGHGMTVTVETTEENALPEGTEFVLAPVSADEERVQDYIAQAAEKNGVDVSAIIPYVYDMHFELDGEEVHIAEGSSVKVNIVFDKALDLGDVVAAPFYHAEGGVLVELIHDVTAKAEALPIRGAKMLKSASPMKAVANEAEIADTEVKTDENEYEDHAEESKTVDSIEFTTGSFSDYMLMGVGGTRSVDKYAILYSNGDLVFQDGDTPDTSRGTVIASWLCTDGITAKEWAGSSYINSIVNVYINTTIQFNPNDNLFRDMTNLVNIYNVQNIDLSNRTNLVYAFYNCSKLQHIYGLAEWDTSSIESIEGIFSECSRLEDINKIEEWNLIITSPTGVQRSFYRCYALTSLDLSGWDLSNVSSAGDMFNMLSGESELTSVNLGNIFTNISSGTIDMNEMFRVCRKLETVNGLLSNLPTAVPVDVSSAFAVCESLSDDIDLSNHTLINVGELFHSDFSITSIDMSGCTLLSSTGSGFASSGEQTFHYCTSLESLDLTGVTAPDSSSNLLYTFSDTPSLRSVDLSSIFFSGGNKGKYFISYSGIEEVILGSDFQFQDAILPKGVWERDSTGEQYTAQQLKDAWNSSMADTYHCVDHTDYDHIYVIQYNNGDLVFQGNDIIDETKGGIKYQWVYQKYPAEVSMAANVNTWRSDQSYRLQVKNIYINTPIRFELATSADQYFAGFDNCEYIYGIDNVDLSNQTSLYNAFKKCQNLIHIYGLDTWDTSTINNIGYAFDQCKKLENIQDIEGWNLTLDNTAFLFAFKSCESLTSLDLSSWDLSGCTSLQSTFSNCKNIQTIDLGNIFTSPAGTGTLNLGSAFEECQKLQSINNMFDNIPLDRGLRMDNMFFNCYELSEPIDLSDHNIIMLTYTFYCCRKLPSIDMSGCTFGNSSAACNINSTFCDCKALTSLDFTGVTCVYELYNGSATFRNTTSLSSLDFTDLVFKAGTKESTFLRNSGITQITLSSNYIFDDDILPPGVWERQSTGDTYTAAELKAAWNSSMADTYIIVDPTDYDNKYAILYSNGDLVFQVSNAPDPNRGTIVASWTPESDGVFRINGISSYKNDIYNLYFETEVQIYYGGNASPFKDLSNCKYIYDIDKWDTSNLTSLNAAFSGCASLKHIYGLAEWDNHTINNISTMFMGNKVLDNINDIASWNLTITGSGLSQTFSSCYDLKVLDLSTWDLSAASSLSETFYSCSALQSVNLGNVFASAVGSINMYRAFYNSKTLYEISDIFANIPANQSVSMTYAFAQCESLEGPIDLHSKSITSLSYAFYQCKSLKYLDLSGCNLAGAAEYAFNECYKLRKLDLSNISASSSATSLSSTFFNTKTLAYLDLSSTYFNAGSKNASTLGNSGITRVTLGSGFQFNSATLPTGNWKRESTGEIYTAAQLKSAWNSSMADTYEKVNVVIFDGNGGTVYPTRLVKHLNEAFEPEDFPSATRKGYTFAGWYSDETAGHEVTAGDIIDQDIYFARWSENHYTLVLKKNDPNDPDDTEIRIPLEYSDVYQLSPDIFTVDNKVLQKWTTSPDGTGTTYGPDERVGMLTEVDNNEVYLYANWGRAQTVTVSFDSQGGAPVESLVIEKYGTLLSSDFTTPSRDGYTFGGWWTDPADGERWDMSDHVVSESVQLYAHWAADPIVTFEPNGGYISKLSKTVPYGGTLSDLPWGSDNSKTLVGFFTSPTFGQGDQLTTSTVITEDVTYYAQWGYQPYFNLAGGRYSGNYSINTAYPLVESSLIEITEFPPVERDGYTLVRWMLPDGTTVNIGDVIDRELYPEIIAEWEHTDTVTVTFDPNGGYFAQYAETNSSTLCKTYEMIKGDALGYYPDAYKVSNTMRLEFLGWFDENENLITRDTLINDDITLHAKWQDDARIPYIFIVYGGQYQAASMYNNSYGNVTGGRKTTVYRTKGEEFGVLPGLSVYSSGATLNGKYLEGWYSDPEPFNTDGTLKDGVEKLTPETAKDVESTWYANIVNNVVDKYNDQTAYKYYTEWTNASNNDVSNNNNNLDFHPQNTNNQTANLHMHFELNAEVTETLPVGSVRITFPKSVWKDWDGNDVGTTNISAQLPKYPQIQSGMFFSYAEDGNGNYIILNNQEISGGAGVDLTIAYTVSPLLVPGGAIDRDNDYVDGYPYYTADVPVLFEIDRDAVTTYETVNDVPVLTDTFEADIQESKTLTLEMHTKVDISIAKEYISTSYGWSDTWGTEPDDANEYFYITWRATTRYNINQPFTQFILEDTVHDGTVVYNSFESQYPSGRSVTANTSTIYYYTIVTRHLKSLLDNIPATGITLRNQVRHKANWKSGYVTDYVADAEHTIYNWSYPAGEFDKSNVRGASTLSSISPFGSIGQHAPTSPRYVTYDGAQNKIVSGQNLTFEWDLVYDGWSSGTPILWDDETDTYSRQQRIISLSDGNNKDIMYSSGKPSARYVWEPVTGNKPLSDYDYTVTRLRVYLREYDGEYRNGEWGGPTLRDDFSMWNEVSIYVRYKNKDELVYFSNLKLSGTGTATTNGYASGTITLPANVAGWEVRYPTSYFKTYLQVNEEVILHPTVEVKKYIQNDVVGGYTSIIKNRGYCDIWTADDVYAAPTGVFFHATDWTGGYNGANKEIYELTYQTGALHTNKSSALQNYVIFDVQRGIQENPMAIYGRNYFATGMQPITSGRFYDLLPRGATVDQSSIYGVLSNYSSYTYIATNYANSYSTNPESLSGYLPREYYDVEFVENWQNSGRTMMIIDYRTPSDNSNMATFYYLLRMTYQDVISYGTSVQNDVAFMDTSGANRYNVTNSSSMKNSISVLGDDATYYETVSVMEDAVVYAVAPTNYIPVDAYSWGFFKSVNTHNGYSQEDITIPNNLYTYRLNYAQSDNAEVTSMVFFDVLERGAYDNAFHDGTLERASEWEGEFDSIDVTPLTTLLKKGSTASNKVYCAPVVYYSTKAKDQFTGSDWDVTNTGTWTTTMPAKSEITAIAVDCTTSSDGTPFVMQGRNSAMFYVRMRSSSDPDDVGKVAVNQGMFKAVVNDEPNEATSDTAVTLTEEEPEIHKESDPETGTAEAPTIVVPGDPLTYTLSVTNKNTQFTVPNIVVEDPIPSALLIDTNNIMVHFGNPDNALTMIQSPRANVRVTGNTLVFTINSLEPEETCYFIIPCSVKNQVGQDIINTATITSVNDVEKEIDSETTYHKVGLRVPFSKLSSNGDYLAGATLQLWNTDGAEAALIEEWTTAGGKYNILLMPGHYILKETDAPEGYEFASDIPFELQVDGTIVFEDDSTGTGVAMEDEAVVHVFGVKTWKYDDAAIRPASITVRLMRMVEGDTDPTYTGESLTVTEQDNWEYDFGNLPKYDNNGAEYIYSVEEVPVTNYTPVYSSGDPNADGLEITFNIRTSTYDSSDRFILYYLYDGRTYGRLFYGNYGESTNPAGTSVQIPSNEFWIAFEADGANNDYGFKIDQIAPVQTTTALLINDRVAPPAWAATATVEEYTGGNFPETDHNYYIYDKLLMHYIRNLEGGSFDIVNVKDTVGFDIPFNKINEDNEQIGGVTLRLTSVPEPGDAEIEPVEWVTVAGESHIEHLYPGHYLLHEVASAAGYLVAEDISFVVDGEGNVIIDENTLTSVDMLDRNIDQPYPFKKVWLDNGYESSRPSSVSFNLIRVSDGQTVETVTLTSADADDAHTWSGEFDPVPVVDNNMVPIEYAVREVVNNNDYLVYHDVQNKVGFYITFSNDSDLGTNAYLKIYPLGYSDPDHPGARQGKGALVLDSALNLSSVEGSNMAGKTYFVPILDGVEGFIITKQLIDTTLPDNSVNLEIESIIPATTLEPYTLIGNTGPAASNIFMGANYPNMNTGVTGTETEIHTFLWQKQEDTAENVANTSSIDEIVNYVNKTEVPFVKLWENENGDTSGRPSTVTFNLYNINDTETVVDTMTVSAGTAASNEYLFTGVPKYNPDGTTAQYIVREDAVSGYHTYYSPDRIFGLLVTFSGTSTAGDGTLKLYTKLSNRINTNATLVDYENGSQVSALTRTQMAGKTYYIPVLDPNNPGFVMELTDDTSKTANVSVTAVVPVDYYMQTASLFPGAEVEYAVNQYFSGTNYPAIQMTEASAANRVVSYEYDASQGKEVHNFRNVTSIPVTKIWDDETAADRPASITINAYNVNAPDTLVGSVTLTVSDADSDTQWSGTITGLPMYNADGTLAQYVLKEAPTAGYRAVYTVPRGMLVTFSEDSFAGYGDTPSPFRLYSVSKATGTLISNVWSASESSPDISGHMVTGKTFYIPIEEAGSYAFAVYKQSEYYTPLKIESVRLTTQAQAYNHADSGIQIPSGAYTYHGAGQLDLTDRNGYIVYDFTGVVEQADNGGASIDGIITNEIPHYYVTFNKHSETYDILPGATLQILKASDDSVVDEWESNVYDHETQLTPGSYILHEDTPPTGFAQADDIEFTLDGEGTLTVNNETVERISMMDNELVEIKGQKSWVGDNASQRPSSITVNLYQNGQLVDSATATAAGDWKYSFPDMPRYDSNGDPYTYTVSETAIHDYTETDLTPTSSESWVADQSDWDMPGNISVIMEPTITQIPVTSYRMKFSSNSKTESNRYDYFYIYYRKIVNGEPKLYKITSANGSDSSGRFGGSIGDLLINIPSNDIYIVWRSDVSMSYWGFQVVDMIPLDTEPTVNSQEVSALPTTDGAYSFGTPLEYTGTSYPETTHNYNDNERIIYHWTGNATTMGYADAYTVSADNGLLVTFDNDSVTNSENDYLTFYCLVGDTWYELPTRLSGNMSSAQVVIPSRTFVMRWLSDSSGKAFGWKVSSVVDYASASVQGCQPVTLPSGTIEMYQGDRYPERQHYGNNESRLYRYIADGLDLPDDEDRFGSAVTANITNTRLPDKQNYSIYKQRPDTTLLGGAILRITGRETGASIDIEPIQWTSSASGPQVVQLRAGQYVLHEVTPPSGYLGAADIPFTIDSTGALIINNVTQAAVYMTDLPQTTIAVDKVDYSHQSTSITGAVLRLYDSNNTALATWTSDGTPHDITEYVTFGNSYRLHEVSAPAGYNIMSEDITVNIASDGTVTLATTEWAVVTGNSVDGYVIKMYNNQGVHFPSTGASDRTWVYLGAVLIMLASAALLIRRKRRHTSA